MAAERRREFPQLRPLVVGNRPSQFPLEQQCAVGFREPAQSDRLRFAPEGTLTACNDHGRFGQRVEQAFHGLARQLEIVDQYETTAIAQEQVKLCRGRLVRRWTIVEGPDQRLEKIADDVPRRIQIHDTVRCGEIGSVREPSQ